LLDVVVVCDMEECKGVPWRRKSLRMANQTGQVKVQKCTWVMKEVSGKGIKKKKMSVF